MKVALLIFDDGTARLLKQHHAALVTASIHCFWISNLLVYRPKTRASHRRFAFGIPLPWLKQLVSFVFLHLPVLYRVYV